MSPDLIPVVVVPKLVSVRVAIEPNLFRFPCNSHLSSFLNGLLTSEKRSSNSTLNNDCSLGDWPDSRQSVVSTVFSVPPFPVAEIGPHSACDLRNCRHWHGHGNTVPHSGARHGRGALWRQPRRNVSDRPQPLSGKNSVMVTPKVYTQPPLEMLIISPFLHFLFSGDWNCLLTVCPDID
jgi:hypothetical protein